MIADRYYYAVYAKATGAGTAVAVTNNDLPGTGAPVVPGGGVYESNGTSPEFNVSRCGSLAVAPWARIPLPLAWCIAALQATYRDHRHGAQCVLCVCYRPAQW